MTRKLTTAEFVEKARSIHGDRYIYDKVEYVDNRTKVIIECKEHGEFEQSPVKHLSGQNCRKCIIKNRGQSQRLNSQKFIEKAIIKHGNTYIYDKVNYIRTHAKVKIICKEHGEFNQEASDHLRGNGCHLCRNYKLKVSHMDTKEKFIEKAILIHNNIYNYDNVNYIDSQTKVIIICKEHGEFEQRPNSHLRGNGCPICGDITTALKRRQTTEHFIIKARDIHKDKYNYDKVEYIDINTKVLIICKEHGEFYQIADRHLQGSGCVECGKITSRTAQTYTTDEFIQRAKEKHNDIYDYSKVRYINCFTNIIIICQKHGEFQQSPNTHVRGGGCPLCINKTEGKLYNYIITKYSDVITHYTADWCINPFTKKKFEFDFYIPSLNIILELDGAHHFNETYYNIDPIMMNKLKDIIKMKMALNHGLHFIRLLQTDIWSASEEWLNTNLLPELVKQDPGFSVVTTNDKIYDSHIELFEQLSLEDAIAMLEPFYQNGTEDLSDSEEGDKE